MFNKKKLCLKEKIGVRFLIKMDKEENRLKKLNLEPVKLVH